MRKFTFVMDFFFNFFLVKTTDTHAKKVNIFI